MLSREVGKVPVDEDVGCDVDDDVCPRAGEVAPVRGNRLLDAFASPGDNDGEVVAVGTEGLCGELLELCKVEGYGIATVDGQVMFMEGEDQKR